MRKSLFMSVFVLMLPVICMSQGTPNLGASFSLELGSSFLNQTLDGERGPNILATDFLFQLDRPDAGAMYRARIHDDTVIWQRLEIGPRLRNVQFFYSLDLKDTLALSGGGVRVSQVQNPGPRNFTPSFSAGVYDRGFCFEGSCAVERAGFVGRIGYSYQKLQDTRWWGPTLSVGWEWGW